MLQPIVHPAMDHHATLRGEVAREDDIRLTLGYRGHGFEHKRADRKSSCALVSRIPVLVAGRIVKFLTCGVNEDRILSLFSVVDFRAR